MKKSAKILAALLATLLCLACAIPAFAEPNSTNPAGSINAGLPFDTGTLQVFKYLMPDLDLANRPNDGGQIGEAAPSDGRNTYDTSIPLSASVVGGIKFKVYKINFADYTENLNLTNAPLDSVYRKLIDDFNQMGWALDKYEDPGAIISAAKDGSGVAYTFPVTQVTNATAGCSGFQADGTLVSSGPVPGTTPVQNITGQDKVTLPKGFYLVVEQLNDLVASISFPFIVAIPMTNAQGDGWIQNVKVYPKNGDLFISKTIDRNAVHVGELVHFTVTVSVPADIRTYYDFFMTDQLDECLTFMKDSLKVYGLGPQHVYEDAFWNTNSATWATPATGTFMNLDPNTIPAGGGTLIPATDGARTNYTLWEPNPPATLVAGKNANNTLRVEFFKNIDNKAASATHPQGFTPPNTWQESREIDNDGFWTLRQYNYVRFEFSAYVNERILDRAGVDPYSPATNSTPHRKGNYWGDRLTPNTDRWNEPAGHGTTGPQSWAYTIFNQATINFRNKFDYKADKDADRAPRYRHRQSNFVKTHTAALYIEKIDANTGAALPGAKFKIADCETCARKGLFLRLIYKDPATGGVTGNFATSANRAAKAAREKYFTLPLSKNSIRATTPAGTFISIEAPFLPGTAHTGTPNNPLWGTLADNSADWIEETKIVTSQTVPYDFSNWGPSWTAANLIGKAVARFEGLKEFGTWNQVYNQTSPPPITATAPAAADYIDMELTPGAEKPVTQKSNAYNTYWLVEVQAPPVPPPTNTGGLGTQGVPSDSQNRPYNLLLEPIQIGFSFDDNTIPNHISNFDNWYTINGGLIRNTNKFTLPRTGGIGTILFTAGGAAIIGVAIFLFILSMRKKKEKEKA